MATATNEITDLEQRFLTEVDAELALVDAELEALRPQLDPLHARRDSLTAFRDRLLGTNSVKPAAKPRAASTGSRAGRGTRKEQFLQDVHAHEGTTIAESAARIGVQPNYFYRIKSEALSEGLIRVEGGKVYPAAKAK